MNMNKTVIALAIVSSLTATSAFARQGNIVDQSGSTNETGNIVVGDIETLMGDICRQSGSNNNCDITIDNVNGDVTISEGVNVTINEIVQGDFTDTVRSDEEIAAIAAEGDAVIQEQVDQNTSTIREVADIMVGKELSTMANIIMREELKKGQGIIGELTDLNKTDASLQAQIDAWVDTDTVRSDKEIKDIAAIGDKILGQEIDELRDMTTAQHNSQNKAIATQWGMIKDVEKVNAEQQVQIDNKVDREEFEADQARQDAAMGELVGGINNVTETVNNLGDKVTNIQGDVTDLGDRVSNTEQAIVNQGDRITNVEGAVTDLGDRVTSVETELGNKVDREEYLVDQARQDAETAKVRDTAETALAGTKANAEKIDAVANESLSRDKAIMKHVAEDQARQDKQIAQNAEASLARDIQLADAVETVDAKSEANKAEIAKVDSASQDRDAAIVANQAKVDAKQDKVFHDYRVTQAQVDAGQYASIDELYGATADLYATQEVHSVQIAGLNSRVSDLENSVNGLKKDVKRLDGMVAANIAASSMETPIDWDGSLAVQVGVGHYNGSNALALGIMGGNEKVVLKATVAATDADNWGKVAVGASATFSTGLLK